MKIKNICELGTVNIQDRIKSLRASMKEEGIDAYIIPSSDPHNSEYASPRWQSRKWISGFTGSAGTVVVLKNLAGLWADGRYHIQAADQIADTGIDLFKAGLPDVPGIEEWLAETLDSNSTVGFDGNVITAAHAAKMKEAFAFKGLKLKSDCDLIDRVWQDRPETPKDMVFEHDLKFAGKSRQQKLAEIREDMLKSKADYFILSSLDDIAWLYNLRGTDVPCCPLFLSFTLISEEKAYLCVELSKIPAELKETLESDGVILKDYSEIYDLVENIGANSSVMYDPKVLNFNLESAIPDSCRKISKTNPTTHAKAVKNSVELENYRHCFERDGKYMVQFIKWLTDNIGKIKITEKSASDYLESLRAADENFHGLSFTTIPGYKGHGAMMHYSVTEESDVELEEESLFLLDSGGLYSDGTTDITRTFALGKLTDEEKRDYTLTLMGHIDLSLAVFLHGTRGIQLDILARQNLWKESINYGCGTGHGVGFFLNVHEGPHNISPGFIDEKLLPGMVVTNEPGVYREGKHGVRVENIMEVVNHSESEFGKFYKFEPLTLCPIDTKPLLLELMSEKQKEWLNWYHSLVFKKLSPHLDDEHRQFLQEATKPV